MSFKKIMYKKLDEKMPVPVIDKGDSDLVKYLHTEILRLLDQNKLMENKIKNLEYQVNTMKNAIRKLDKR